MTVYVRLSNDKSTWTGWQQINNGGLINDSNFSYRYLQYRVEMKTTNSSLKPYLENIVANYTAVVTNASGDYAYNFSSPSVFGNYPVKVNTTYNTIYAEASATLSVQLGVSPIVTLISPGTGLWFNYSNLTLIYNVTDINDDMVNSTLFINGLVNKTNSTGILNGQYNNFTINFTNGNYNWTVHVRDSYNNLGNDTPRSFYIDLENPNVSLLDPPHNSVQTLNLLNLSFNVTDNLDGVLDCVVVLDGGVLDSVTANNSKIKNVSSGILGAGPHYWNVTCTDESNRTHLSDTWTFNVSDIPPNVTLEWPYNNYMDTDGSIGFIFNATDDSGFRNCTLLINDSYDTNNQTAINNGQNNTITRAGLLEGNYNWSVVCFDLSDNSDQPSPRDFSVDLYYPSIELNAPSDLANLNNSDVSFNFTANDSFDGSLDCNLTVNGINYGMVATSGQLTNKLVQNLTDGVKYWNVSCEDDAGHSNISSTWSVNITEPPSIELNTSNESAVTVGSINLSYITLFR